MRKLPTARARLLRMVRNTQRTIMRGRLLLAQTENLVRRSEALAQIGPVVPSGYYVRVDEIDVHLLPQLMHDTPDNKKPHPGRQGGGQDGVPPDGK